MVGNLECDAWKIINCDLHGGYRLPTDALKLPRLLREKLGDRRKVRLVGDSRNRVFWGTTW